MPNTTLLRRALLALCFACSFTVWSCGPVEPPLDCVSGDEGLGSPADREWCEGEFFPPMMWEGKRADKALPICLPPQADGSCELCPSAKVIADVESALYPHLETHRPQCQLEHWEFGCMRTIENAIEIGREPDYCCFEVALWGPFCADQP